MDITRDASGAIKLTTDGGMEVWYINNQDVTIKSNEVAVSIMFMNRNLDLPLKDLSINGVAYVGDGNGAAELVATTIFYGA